MSEKPPEKLSEVSKTVIDDVVEKSRTPTPQDIQKMAEEETERQAEDGRNATMAEEETERQAEDGRNATMAEEDRTRQLLDILLGVSGENDVVTMLENMIKRGKDERNESSSPALAYFPAPVLPDLERRYKKNFSPFVNEEPWFVLRARDDLAVASIKDYRRMLLEHGVRENSFQVRSIDEIIQMFDTWRIKNTPLCHISTF